LLEVSSTEQAIIIGFLAHSVRKPALAVVGHPQNDRLVYQAGLFERVQHFDDVPVDQLVQVGVESHIFALRDVRRER